MTRKWSTYQTAIFADVENTTCNLAIDAVAGSGKTTTLVEVSNRLPRSKRVVFLAFNKHIVNELQSRMQGVECKTIHSLGYGACAAGYTRGKIRMDEHKVGDLIDQMLDTAQDVPLAVFGQFKKVVREIVDKGRLTLCDLGNTRAVDAMLDHFGILADLVTAAQNADVGVDYLVTRAIKVARKVLDRSNDLYTRKGVIDFTDMIYLPAAKALPVKKYDVVLIDEAQDLNAAQLTVVLAAAGNRGRIIAVGDPKQAIMGFSGAANDSFDNIVERTRAKVLPLSLCYRCPTSHLDMARELVPHIEAAPNAAEGQIERITFDLAHQIVREGDLFICRRNAPLIGAALKLIAKGVQARVRGRNIAAGLVKMIDDASKITVADSGSWRATFTKQLTRLIDIKIEMLAAKEHTEIAQETVRDQGECVFTFLDGAPEIGDVETLKTRLEALFADEGAAVWLSSIHRAKGLEADRVLILDPDRIEITRKGMLDWQREQERNLHYVALTRAKKSLYLVELTPTPGAEAKTTVGDNIVAPVVA